MAETERRHTPLEQELRMTSLADAVMPHKPGEQRKSTFLMEVLNGQWRTLDPATNDSYEFLVRVPMVAYVPEDMRITCEAAAWDLSPDHVQCKRMEVAICRYNADVPDEPEALWTFDMSMAYSVSVYRFTKETDLGAHNNAYGFQARLSLYHELPSMLLFKIGID